MLPLEAFAADLLALLDSADISSAAPWDRPGTAPATAVPAAVPDQAPENPNHGEALRGPGPLGPPGPHETHDSVHAPASSEEPRTHCPTCGAPSWWLSPGGWCCAYCVPRPHPFLGASVVIADTWADGRAPALDEEPGHPAEREPVRPDDGRTQDPAGAWRSPGHPAACAAFHAHHAACPTCRRAGQRRDLARCDVGRRLHVAYALAALSDRRGRA